VWPVPPFSSAPAHVTGRADELAEWEWLDERIAGWVCTWAEHLGKDDGPAATGGEAIGRILHRHEGTGRPLGERPFVQRIAQLLGRDLTPRRPGRPRNHGK